MRMFTNKNLETYLKLKESGLPFKVKLIIGHMPQYMVTFNCIFASRLDEHYEF
jgi:hypothetical protein